MMTTATQREKILAAREWAKNEFATKTASRGSNVAKTPPSCKKKKRVSKLEKLRLAQEYADANFRPQAPSTTTKKTAASRHRQPVSRPTLRRAPLGNACNPRKSHDDDDDATTASNTTPIPSISTITSPYFSARQNNSNSNNERLLVVAVSILLLLEMLMWTFAQFGW